MHAPGAPDQRGREPVVGRAVGVAHEPVRDEAGLRHDDVGRERLLDEPRSGLEGRAAVAGVTVARGGELLLREVAHRHVVRRVDVEEQAHDVVPGREVPDRELRRLVGGVVEPPLLLLVVQRAHVVDRVPALVDGVLVPAQELLPGGADGRHARAVEQRPRVRGPGGRVVAPLVAVDEDRLLRGRVLPVDAVRVRGDRLVAGPRVVPVPGDVAVVDHVQRAVVVHERVVEDVELRLAVPPRPVLARAALGRLGEVPVVAGVAVVVPVVPVRLVLRVGVRGLRRAEQADAQRRLERRRQVGRRELLGRHRLVRRHGLLRRLGGAVLDDGLGRGCHGVVRRGRLRGRSLRGGLGTLRRGLDGGLLRRGCRGRGRLGCGRLGRRGDDRVGRCGRLGGGSLGGCRRLARGGNRRLGRLGGLGSRRLGRGRLAVVRERGERGAQQERGGDGGRGGGAKNLHGGAPLVLVAGVSR
ncbi:Uncharacterised protein [Mycobacteroides abscessus]|nr:Uncharacterised protein [Mycobacteroides abscessus]